MAPYKPFPIGKNRIKFAAAEKSLSEMINKLVKIEKKRMSLLLNFEFVWPDFFDILKCIL